MGFILANRSYNLQKQMKRRLAWVALRRAVRPAEGWKEGLVHGIQRLIKLAQFWEDCFTLKTLMKFSEFFSKHR